MVTEGRKVDYSTDHCRSEPWKGKILDDSKETCSTKYTLILEN